MHAAHVYSFLVQPSKNADKQPRIPGVRIPSGVKLFDILSNLYESAEKDCSIEIIFRPTNGHQNNECRDLLTDYLARPALVTGRAVAKRLQAVTTHRSGLGLFFLVDGAVGKGRKLLLSRFPADQGVVAEAKGEDDLAVEFVEQIFLKSAKAYKAATYTEAKPGAGFWVGRAVDKQTNQVRELTNYWISEFLDSDLHTTPAAGSKRLAVAMREAIRTAPTAAVRSELLAATQLLPARNGNRVSPQELAQSFGFSPEAIATLRKALPRPEIYADTFEFSAAAFQEAAPYRSVELDNEGVLIAPQPTFSEVFREERGVGPNRDRVRYTTEGKVVDERLRKTK